jgi:ribonuclease HI
LPKVTIYTDGACSGNPGPGGYGALLIFGTITKEISGSEPHTTNNRMELLAIVEALKILEERTEVTLYSDSAYAVNCINQKWYQKWRANGWLTSKKQPVENKDLWEKILQLLTKHNVTFMKVKGHSDNIYNNRCDQLARNAIKRS